MKRIATMIIMILCLSIAALPPAGASALGEAGEIHRQLSAEIFRRLYQNGYIEKLSVPQFYDQELGIFLNGRQVTGRCPIPGCTSDRA